MTHPLDSIWIIDSTSGICYLHRVFNQEKDFGDETMFSGFISAIMNFVSSTTKESIEGIVLGGFDIHIKSFDLVIVVLSTKKNSVMKNLDETMDKVGSEFTSMFEKKINSGLVSVQDFEPFGDNIDRIFGIKTIQIIPEHEALIELIKNSENVDMPEEKSIESIILFFKSLPDYKRKIIIENVNRILMSVMKDSRKAALLTNITADVSDEFNTFKQILKSSQQKHLNEDDLITEIVKFFDSIPVEKKPSLMNKTKGAMEILKPSKKIDKEIKKKFDTLLTIV